MSKILVLFDLTFDIFIFELKFEFEFVEICLCFSSFMSFKFKWLWVFNILVSNLWSEIISIASKFSAFLDLILTSSFEIF